MIWHKCVLIYDATFYDRVVREEINKIKSKSTEIISITMKINIIYIYILVIGRVVDFTVGITD